MKSLLWCSQYKCGQVDSRKKKKHFLFRNRTTEIGVELVDFWILHTEWMYIVHAQFILRIVPIPRSIYFFIENWNFSVSNDRFKIERSWEKMSKKWTEKCGFVYCICIFQHDKFYHCYFLFHFSISFAIQNTTIIIVDLFGRDILSKC